MRFKEINGQEERGILILVKDATHIYWQNGKPITERKNRQYLDPIYHECGGVIITSEIYLKYNGKILSEHPCLYVCPPDESVDINDWFDLLLAEKLLNRKKIGFTVVGNYKAGIGHVRRCITLAMHLIEHETIFFINKNKVCYY